MPFVILLRQTTQTFARGAEQVTPWGQLALLEAQIVRRMRTAFLVHWFGRSVPTVGPYLQIAIANLDALRERFARLARLRSDASQRVNLTEPLLGIMGAAAGAAITPLFAAGIGWVLYRLAWANLSILQKIGSVIVGGLVSVASVPIAALVAAIGIPVSAVAAAVMHTTVRNVVSVLGALAEFMDASLTLVDQILGRSEVQNPLLARLLDLFDRTGQLLVQIVGASAFLFVHVAGELQRLARQIGPFMRLFDGVAETIAFIFNDLLDRILWVVDLDEGPFASVRRVQHVLTDFVEMLSTVVSSRALDYASRLQSGWEATRLALQRWWTDVQREVSSYVQMIPLIRLLREAVDVFELAADVLPDFSSSSGSSSEGLLSSPQVREVGQNAVDVFSQVVIGESLGTPPPVPETPDVNRMQQDAGVRSAASFDPDWVAMLTGFRQMRRELGFGGDNPFAGIAPSDEELAALTQTASVFAAERRRLRAGHSSVDARLRAMRQEQLQLRDRLQTIVSHVLPTSVAAYVVELDDLFRTLDETVYEVNREARDFEPPVQAILESQRLRPVVRTLNVSVPGEDTRDAAGSWADRLQELLQEQSYLAAE